MGLRGTPTGDCAWCGQRPAAVWWTEGAVAFVHGMATGVCERCCVSRQLAHAREMAARIPALEAQLAALDESADNLLG